MTFESEMLKVASFSVGVLQMMQIMTLQQCIYVNKFRHFPQLVEFDQSCYHGDWTDWTIDNTRADELLSQNNDAVHHLSRIGRYFSSSLIIVFSTELACTWYLSFLRSQLADRKFYNRYTVDDDVDGIAMVHLTGQHHKVWYSLSCRQDCRMAAMIIG